MNIFTEDSDKKMDFNIIRKKNLKNLKPRFRVTFCIIRNLCKMIENFSLFIKFEEIPTFLMKQHCKVYLFGLNPFRIKG